jgi:putative endonuclease
MTQRRNNKKKGMVGELLAANYLQSHGYELIDKNIQIGHLEIDLLLKKEDAYYFVEVKYRKNRSFGDPIEAMTKQKCLLFKRAVFAYLSRHQMSHEIIHLSFMGILEENGSLTYNWITDFFA